MTLESFESRLNGALRRFVETNLIGVLFTDLAGNIITADDSFLSIAGYTREALPASLRELTSFEHHRLDEEALEKLMAFGACAPFEKDLVRADGSILPVLFAAALQEDEIACFVVDLSQHKQAQAKLNHLAYHDALTDLPNQVLFKDRLKQAIAYSRRTDQMHAVLLLNLDRFKTINDSLGYTAGDRLLQSVAQRLTSCVRESDTVARFGSDEFAVLLT
ncbi:MAG TPA: diguanylate cyclase, partial [Pyrinomonadaceae bacterium]